MCNWCSNFEHFSKFHIKQEENELWEWAYERKHKHEYIPKIGGTDSNIEKSTKGEKCTLTSM